MLINVPDDIADKIADFYLDWTDDILRSTTIGHFLENPEAVKAIRLHMAIVANLILIEKEDALNGR